jgi:phosphoribosyl 1,2-cyclic phosphate phosphodiesterase
VVESGGGERLLVDTGPDMRLQLLANRVPRVDSILFTHAHADHITGMDDVRILNRIVERPLAAYGTQRTLDELGRRFDYAFRPWTPPGFFRPVLQPHVVAFGDRFTTAGIEVHVFEQDHGYMPTLGLRVGPFAYSTDVVSLNDAAFAALAGVDTWVVGCFQRTAHSTHASLARVLEWAGRVSARRTVLTHMGPDMDWAWLQANLPPGLEAGMDGLVLDFPDA